VLVVLGRGVVAWDEPVVRADDLGLQRGDGLFETARLSAGRPVLLAGHLERMAAGAAALALAVPPDAEWHDAVTLALAEYGPHDGVLKLVCTRGPEGGTPVAFVQAFPAPALLARQRAEGVSALTLTLGLTSTAAAEAPWLLRGVKSLSYAVNLASLRAAAERGADDAIWVGSDGVVLEAPTANVVWVRGDEAVTPPAEIGLLRGITLGALRAGAATRGVRLVERPGTVDELRAADEVLLTSSIRGVCPVVRLDGAPVGSGAVGSVTASLRAAYEELCVSGP
jgi:4-amino-4-deoxychorismate lyase